MQRAYQPTELGKIVRARRKEHHVILRECAEKVGVSRQSVSQIEMGKNRGGNSKLIEDLAQVLDLDERELLLTRPKRRLCKKQRRTQLGGFLTRQRLKSHLTQNEVAERAGVSPTTVLENERGKHLSKRSTLSKIGWALECDIPVKLYSGAWYK